jgi:hypothetical protein
MIRMFRSDRMDAAEHNIPPHARRPQREVWGVPCRMAGRRNVKIAAVEDGSVISLGGDETRPMFKSFARGANTSLKLITKDGKQQSVKP